MSGAIHDKSVLLASGARTASTTSADQTNYEGQAHIIFINVSAVTATPAVTPYLQIKDSISGNYKTVWTAGAAIATTGQYVYLFGLGVLAAAAGSFTEAVNIRLGCTWRLGATHGDTDSITYSASAETLV